MTKRIGAPAGDFEAQYVFDRPAVYDFEFDLHQCLLDLVLPSRLQFVRAVPTSRDLGVIVVFWRCAQQRRVRALGGLSARGRHRRRVHNPGMPTIRACQQSHGVEMVLRECVAVVGLFEMILDVNILAPANPLSVELLLSSLL